jgi:hypothetical protein
MRYINRNAAAAAIDLPICGCFIVWCDERVRRGESQE